MVVSMRTLEIRAEKILVYMGCALYEYHTSFQVAPELFRIAE